MFLRSAEVQQRVLQMDSAQERLQYIIATLEDATKRLVAQRALASVFSTKISTDDADAPEDGRLEDEGLLSGMDSSETLALRDEARDTTTSESDVSADKEESGASSKDAAPQSESGDSSAAGSPEAKEKAGQDAQSREQKAEATDAGSESDSASRGGPEKRPD